jgi:hypothetical protein
MQGSQDGYRSGEVGGRRLVAVPALIRSSQAIRRHSGQYSVGLISVNPEHAGQAHGIPAVLRMALQDEQDVEVSIGLQMLHDEPPHLPGECVSGQSTSVLIHPTPALGNGRDHRTFPDGFPHGLASR